MKWGIICNLEEGSHFVSQSVISVLSSTESGKAFIFIEDNQRSVVYSRHTGNGDNLTTEPPENRKIFMFTRIRIILMKQFTTWLSVAWTSMR
jgi:hypothetical protein